MRRSIISFIASIFAMGMFAQGYSPVLKPGREWVCNWEAGMKTWKCTYTVASDTVLDGNMCYRVDRSIADWSTGEVVYENKGFSILREEECKIWLLDGPDSWLPLYDFTLEIGDNVPCNADFTVSAVDTLYVCGRQLRRLVLQGEVRDVFTGAMSTVEDYWVEGIGSTSGLRWRYEWGRTSEFGTLQSCYEGGACTFRGNDFVPHRPLLEEGKTWTYCQGNTQLPTSYVTYTLGGDTIIGNSSYKKVYEGPGAFYRCSLREEGRKVFYVEKDADEELLLYDFDAMVGDTLPVMGIECRVSQTSVYRADGHGYGSIELSREDNGSSLRYLLLDGIGSTDDLLRPLQEYWVQQYLVQCEVAGRVIYGASTATMLTDRGVSPSRTAMPVFDLQGRRLNGVPQRGVYIRDGRKVVVK